MDTLSGDGAFVYGQHKYFFTTGTGGSNHAFTEAKPHFSSG
jgi:hypothetical protein